MSRAASCCPRPAPRLREQQQQQQPTKSQIDGSSPDVASLALASTKSDDFFVEPANESEPLTLLKLSALAEDDKSKRLKTYIRAREVQFVAHKGNPVCVMTELREGGGVRVAQDLWESFDRRLNWVVVAENSLWIVELPAGMVHDGVALEINTQLKIGIHALGLNFFSLPGAALVEIDDPDFDKDMAPDGQVLLKRGPTKFIEHARLFVEVGDSQALGRCNEPTTLLGRTADWLRCKIAENICVLVVKLYGEVDIGPSSDGMTMALITEEGVQWIRSWGDTSQDDTAGIFGQFSEDLWEAAPPTTPAVETTGSVCHISLVDHFPVLDQQSMQKFAKLFQQEVQVRVLGGAPQAYAGTLEALTKQVKLLKDGNQAAIFQDGATIAIDGDRIFAEYQDQLDEKRERAKRRRLNP